MIYNASSIFVLPSLADNLPNTALEAQSCATPVLGFNIGGMSDAIQDGSTGFLINPLDIHHLSFHIQQLFRDPDLVSLLSYQARSRSLNLWSPKQVASAYYNVYQNVISNPPEIVSYDF